MTLFFDKWRDCDTSVNTFERVDQRQSSEKCNSRAAPPATSGGQWRVHETLVVREGAAGASWSGTWTGRGCRAGIGGRGCGRGPPPGAPPPGPAGPRPRRTARASPGPSAPDTHPWITIRPTRMFSLMCYHSLVRVKYQHSSTLISPWKVYQFQILFIFTGYWLHTWLHKSLLATARSKNLKVIYLDVTNIQVIFTL